MFNNNLQEIGVNRGIKWMFDCYCKYSARILN